MVSVSSALHSWQLQRECELMGYTTTDKCHEDMELPQTPENVRRVIERAGWNFHEAATATGIHHARVNGAIYGSCNLTESEWRLLLREAGRRKFDYE
jgi:hypothetical protein